MVRRGNFEGGGDQTFAAEHAKTKTPPRRRNTAYERIREVESIPGFFSMGSDS